MKTEWVVLGRRWVLASPNWLPESLGRVPSSHEIDELFDELLEVGNLDPGLLESWQEFVGGGPSALVPANIAVVLLPGIRDALDAGTLRLVELPWLEATVSARRREQPAASGGAADSPARPPSAARRTVPPPPLPVHRYSIRVVDELRVPIASVPLLVKHAGLTRRLQTDAAGMARFEAASDEVAQVFLSDLVVLRERVRARWDLIREGELVQDGDSTVVVSLHADPGQFGAIAEKLLTLSVRPFVARCGLLAGFFDRAKSFLLPASLTAARRAVALALELAPATSLIVGHTDTLGSAEFNDALSIERAQATDQFLRGDVDGWLAHYDVQDQEKRWGRVEDLTMILALDDAGTRGSHETPLRWFQRTRGLEVDGVAGPQTRRALVTAYMARLGPTMPANVSTSCHGCGENFPAEATADGVADAANRRVEIFFFDDRLGVQPQPPGDRSGPGSVDYPEWLKRLRHDEDHRLQEVPRQLRIFLQDTEHQRMPRAPFHVTIAGRLHTGNADALGLAVVEDATNADQCFVEWGFEGDQELLFHASVALEPTGDRDRDAMQKLERLGYAGSLQERVAAFQVDYDLPRVPWYDSATEQTLNAVDETGQDAPLDDADSGSFVPFVQSLTSEDEIEA